MCLLEIIRNYHALALVEFFFLRIPTPFPHCFICVQKAESYLVWKEMPVLEGIASLGKSSSGGPNEV